MMALIHWLFIAAKRQLLCELLVEAIHADSKAIITIVQMQISVTAHTSS